MTLMPRIISLLIAKMSKPHAFGEDFGEDSVLQAANEITENGMQESASSVLDAEPLSNDTFQHCIDEMSDNMLKQLVGILSVR